MEQSKTVDIPQLSAMVMETTTPSDVRASADFVMRHRRKYMTMFNRRYTFFSNGTIIAIGSDQNKSDDTLDDISNYVFSATNRMATVTCEHVTPRKLRYKVYGYDQVTRRMMVVVSFEGDDPGIFNIVGLDEIQLTHLNSPVRSMIDTVKVLLAARINVARSNDMQTQKLVYIALPDNCLYSSKENAIVKNTGRKYIVRSF